MTSVKNEFIGLQDCADCDGASFTGEWWVASGELFVESTV